MNLSDLCKTNQLTKIDSIEESKRNFEKELRQLINKYSMENDSDTPDFILAEYLKNCLENFNNTIVKRGMWYDRQ